MAQCQLRQCQLRQSCRNPTGLAGRWHEVDRLSLGLISDTWPRRQSAVVGLRRNPAESGTVSANENGPRPGFSQDGGRFGVRRRSDVEVHLELVRVWAEPDLVDLVRALVVDPGVDQVLGEDATLEQVILVGFECEQYLR